MQQRLTRPARWSSEAWTACVAALENHVAAFETLAAAFHERWKRHDRLLVFAPDHGAHKDPSTDRGTHGTNLPEDLDLVHYYGVFPGEPSS